MRVADTQDSIGLALQGLKRNEEALTHMRQALALRTRILGPDHEILGYSLHNIGRLLASMGRKQEALDYYQRGLALRERALGKEHPLTALLLESIGIYLMENGQVQDGLPLIERSLAINRKALGESHLETLESHRNLVIANLLAKRYPRAIAHLDELLSHNPPSSLRVDLDDKDLAPLHAYPRFAALRKRFESVADAEIP
jgi:tetratricopeptide (TPR) repeat protein